MLLKLNIKVTFIDTAAIYPQREIKRAFEGQILIDKDTFNVSFASYQATTARGSPRDIRGLQDS